MTVSFSPCCMLHVAISRRRSVLFCKVAQSSFKWPYSPTSPSTCFGAYNFLYWIFFGKTLSRNLCWKKYKLSEKLYIYIFSGIYPLSSILPATIDAIALFISYWWTSVSSSTWLNANNTIRVIILKLLRTCQFYAWDTSPISQLPTK